MQENMTRVHGPMAFMYGRPNWEFQDPGFRWVEPWLCDHAANESTSISVSAPLCYSAFQANIHNIKIYYRTYIYRFPKPMFKASQRNKEHEKPIHDTQIQYQRNSENAFIYNQRSTTYKIPGCRLWDCSAPATVTTWGARFPQAREESAL